MSFKVALIVDEATDFSLMKKRFEEMGLEFWQKGCKTEEELIAASQSADFIVTIISKYPFTPKVIERLTRCKFIETYGVGYDGIDLDVATEHGIGVINNADYPVEELSDHTMALILACARRIVQLNNVVKGVNTGPSSQSRHELQEIGSKMIRLRGKTLGLVGFGRIARGVAFKSRAFGMKVVAFDPYVQREEIEKHTVEKCSLEQLLEVADFVSIHAVLTPETRHLIGLEQFKRMKRGSFIVNTARGSIIDEKALHTALAEGFIAGAALDVTEPEPPAINSPLLKLDNVILTGHSGHSSPESSVHRQNRPAEEIARVMRQEWPIGLVNPQVKEKYVRKWGQMFSSK